MSGVKGTVLVTGASGFIAKHVILRLLQEGYAVRGSLRTPTRADEVRAALAPHVDIANLTFRTFDLYSDYGWEDACFGCDYVQHIASPFPAAEPKYEDELIIPARDGALRALRNAAQVGVHRVVMTSSVAAIAYGHEQDADHVYDESDWTNVDKPVGAYIKSKTIAEQAAWKWVKSGEAGEMELSVICPGLVLGPVLDADFSTSGVVVQRLIKRQIPGVPRISFTCIDVRDVAEAHVRAMTYPKAAGERFMLANPSVWMVEIAKALKECGYDVPTNQLPDFMVRLVAIFDKSVRLAARDLGRKSKFSNAKLVEVLGIQPRGLKEMVSDMAASMREHGVG